VVGGGGSAVAGCPRRRRRRRSCRNNSFFLIFLVLSLLLPLLYTFLNLEIARTTNSNLDLQKKKRKFCTFILGLDLFLCSFEIVLWFVRLTVLLLMKLFRLLLCYSFDDDGFEIVWLSVVMLWFAWVRLVWCLSRLCWFWEGLLWLFVLCDFWHFSVYFFVVLQVFWLRSLRLLVRFFCSCCAVPFSVCFQAVFIERSLGHQGSEVNGIRVCWRGAE